MLFFGLLAAGHLRASPLLVGLKVASHVAGDDKSDAEKSDSPKTIEAGSPVQAKDGAGDAGVPSSAVLLEKDLEKLGQRIEDTQKALDGLRAQFPGAKPKAEEPLSVVPRQAFVKTYVSLFVSCLEERSIEVQRGVQEIGQKLGLLLQFNTAWVLWVEMGILLLIFGVVSFVALALGYGTHKWLDRLLGGIFKWALAELSEKPKLQSFFRFLIGVLKAALPVIVVFVSQLSLFFLVERSDDLRKAMLSFATGLFFWFLTWRLQDLLFGYVPQGILGNAAATQKLRRSFKTSLQFFLFFWLVDDWLITLFSFAGLSQESNALVMLIFGLGMTVSSVSLIQLIRKPLWRWIKSSQEKQFPFLTTLFWLFWNTFPVALYMLFVLDTNLFNQFFLPVVLTTLLLPLIPLLYRGLKRLRMAYLWAVRHDPHKGIWFRFLRPKQQAFQAIYLLTYGLTGIFIIEVWDVRFLHYLKLIVGGHAYDQLADIIFLSVVAWAAIHFGDRVLKHYMDRRAAHQEEPSLYFKGRMRTLLMTSRTALRISVLVTCGLIVLSKLGYNITPIITNLGLFSVVLSFGVQSFVKDFFAGLFILLDNNVVVGDWVDIDGKLGIVEELSLRTIKVRADSGTLMTIPFGSIKVIGNRSRHFSCFLINLPVPYDTDPEKAYKILEEAYTKLKRMPAYRKKIMSPIEIRGVNDIVSFALVMQAKLRTNPTEQEFVRRGYNRILKEILDREGLRVPSPPYPVSPDKMMSVSKKGTPLQ